MSETLMNFVLVGLGGFILGSVRWSWFIGGYKKHVTRRAEEILDERITKNQIDREIAREHGRIKAAKDRTATLSKRKEEELARGPQKFKPKPTSESFSKQNSLQPKNQVPYSHETVNKAGLIARMRDLPSKVAKSMKSKPPKEKLIKPEEGLPPKPSPPLEKPFEHRFYGTQLTVGNFRLVSNLAKGMHTLEIVQDVLYVDNKPYPANSGDVERMKSLIREGRV